MGDATLKRLFEQVSQLVIELQIIADALGEYNPGLCKDKTPLPVIQYDVASVARELAGLHGKIGEKIRDEINSDSPVG